MANRIDDTIKENTGSNRSRANMNREPRADIHKHMSAQRTRVRDISETGYQGFADHIDNL